MPVGNLQNDRSQRAALAELQVTAAGLPASLALKQNVTFAPNELGLGTVERALAARYGGSPDAHDFRLQSLCGLWPGAAAGMSAPCP